MNLPAHSSLKCELGTYKPTRSYPHTRVQPIRTSLPASITHLTTPLRTSPLVTNPAYPWPSYWEKERKRPCKSICKGPLPLHSRLAPLQRPLGETRSRPPGGVFLPPGAWPHHQLCCVAYRLAGLLPPPGATPVKTLLYWFIYLHIFSCTFNH